MDRDGQRLRPKLRMGLRCATLVSVGWFVWRPAVGLSSQFEFALGVVVQNMAKRWGMPAWRKAR